MRSCPTCGKTVEGSPNRIYCDGDCKRRKAPKANTPVITAALKELTIDKDLVREVLREEVRDAVQQHVRDNLLSSIEQMAGLAPKVIAALDEDLDTKDWAVRSRAYQYWLRYILPFAADKNKADESDRIIVITHSTPLPDHSEVIEGEAEAFEADWEVCARCDERRHPENMMEGVCSACRVRDQFKIERAADA